MARTLLFNKPFDVLSQFTDTPQTPTCNRSATVSRWRMAPPARQRLRWSIRPPFGIAHRPCAFASLCLTHGSPSRSPKAATGRSAGWQRISGFRRFGWSAGALGVGTWMVSRLAHGKTHQPVP